MVVWVTDKVLSLSEKVTLDFIDDPTNMEGLTKNVLLFKVLSRVADVALLCVTRVTVVDLTCVTVLLLICADENVAMVNRDPTLL